jgi:hypothetical protein
LPFPLPTCLLQTHTGIGALAGALQALLQTAQLGDALIGAFALDLTPPLEIVAQIRKAQACQRLRFLLLQRWTAVVGPGWCSSQQAQQQHQRQWSRTHLQKGEASPLKHRPHSWASYDETGPKL